ncbi:LysM peptidoglycan-binding domain-containing protein [Serinicoccus chungangensis]|uniref:LysM peptidoglycan-binding domain-containing protein n=1 Tax=Serinicoccus chungangensis TaxID=767452 RepID=UPI00193113BB|nr:LysM domain-containing protein [Serinicoccus chungangensis]
MGLIDRIRGALRGRRPGAAGAAADSGARPESARPAAAPDDAAAGATPDQAAAEPTSTSAPSEGRHPTATVQPGDTLADLAARHGVDEEGIVRLNGIPDPELIFAGQVFRLPRDPA